jgi:hypothetical protein
MGNAFAAQSFESNVASGKGSIQDIAAYRPAQMAPRSFYDLVRAPKLNDMIFFDAERLKCFGDINTRYNGYTPLHTLIMRPDATIQHIKALLDRGANIHIPVLVKTMRGQTEAWDSYRAGCDLIGITPDENKKILNQYYGNSEVMQYIFQVMVGQKIEEQISKARRDNRLKEEDEGFCIAQIPCKRRNWAEMGDDEARELLKEKAKDRKEYERLLENLSPRAFEAFLKMEEYYVV